MVGVGIGGKHVGAAVAQLGAALGVDVDPRGGAQAVLCGERAVE